MTRRSLSCSSARFRASGPQGPAEEDSLAADLKRAARIRGGFGNIPASEVPKTVMRNARGPNGKADPPSSEIRKLHG